MPTLAINTSANVVSVALLEQATLIDIRDSRVDYSHRKSASTGGHAGASDQLPPGYTQKRSKRGQATRRVFAPGASVMLAPLLKDLLAAHELSVKDIDLIAVAIGPGLFTGLRVGVVTAKSLAYAGKADLVSVNTLEASAAQAGIALATATDSHADPEQPKLIHAVLNAQRQQLFAGTFREVAPWVVERVAEDAIVARSAWIESLQSTTEPQWVTGSGLKPIVDQVRDQPANVEVLEEADWDLSASSVGQIAWQKYSQGQRDDFWTIEPLYFRPSAAEEQRLG